MEEKTNKEVFGAGARLVGKRASRPADAGRNLAGVSGVDLMNKLTSGELTKVPKEFVEKTRKEISENMEELLEFGCRIRPLIVGKEQIGWVRGVHNSERRILDRWLTSNEDRILNILSLATTFSREELEMMSSSEIHRLMSVIRQMTERDLSLYPYMAAYASTFNSENLWHGSGHKLCSYEDRKISLPNGKSMRIMTPPEHAKLWATLCTYREQAKRRLDDNFNAVMIIRPLAGRSADPISNDLRGVARRLQADSIEPWEQIVRVQRDASLDDGWAHAGADDSKEGLIRELKGMMEGDKHERFIALFEKLALEQADDERKRIETIIAARGGAVGIIEETMEVLTPRQVEERGRELQEQRRKPPKVDPVEREVFEKAQERLKRYQ